MAPSHSKPIGDGNKKKRALDFGVLDSSMTKVAKGTAIFTDEFAEAMATGKRAKLPKNLDDIVEDVDKENVQDSPQVSKAKGKGICPKYSTSSNPFKLFDDATWHSDGEDVKWYNIKCQGTEESPCSTCSDPQRVTRMKAGMYTPSPTPPKAKATQFVQAQGYKPEDFEGEEETPQKVSANACKWCQRDPCIIQDEESRDEGAQLVEDLKEDPDITMKNIRFQIYRMYARQLGYVGFRHILPRCVGLFIDEMFVEPGETRTGYKDKPTNK